MGPQERRLKKLELHCHHLERMVYAACINEDEREQFGGFSNAIPSLRAREGDLIEHYHRMTSAREDLWNFLRKIGR